ncbi:major facilitator superfamily domain-containing protein [Flammula alnicola]|nr:major facilitator superfamily domain-containing protein [Flammula alnicola]
MPPSEHSRVRDSSRPTSRNTTSSQVLYVPQAESLILPDGPVGEEAAELLNEFVHPHRHGTEETLVGLEEASKGTSDDNDLDKKRKAPWWKRPSPWWLITAVPFTSIAASLTIAPRIEIYTMLACSVHKPDIFRQNFPGIELGLQDISREPSELGLRGLSTLPNPYSPHLVPVYLPKASFLGLVQKNGSVLPTHRNQCASDPVVQAAVAKLTAVIAACMGILSCITTGWWGAFSDRHGRTRVMGISILGLLLTDFNFIMVASFSKHIPGGYWFLVVGPIVEGFLGGMTTGIAAMHGYVADTTNESARSRVFSLSLGLLFIGIALGPTLGSLLIHVTGQTLSVFYVATGLHVLYSIFIWTILPESVSQKRMSHAKTKYALEVLEIANERERNPAISILVKARRLFAFLSPLTVFSPAEEENAIGNPLKGPKRDWNLTLLVLAYAFTISIMASYSYKFQYAASNFGWSSETLGYWLSLVGATRAIFLTVILPIAIKLFKPKPIILEIPVAPRETTPLLDGTDNASQTLSSSTTQVQKTIKKEIHSPSFDLNLARASIFIEVIAYTCMGLSPTPMAFTMFGIMGSLGAGFSPAVQSVTLALYARRGGTETGRLFGALSVVQALASQIIGPSIYGLVYMKTVATYPRTIFFVSVATVTISFFFLSLIRLPKEKDYRRERFADLEEVGPASEPQESLTMRVQEGTLVDIDDSSNDRESDRAARKRHVNVLSYGATKPPSVHAVR